MGVGCDTIALMTNKEVAVDMKFGMRTPSFKKSFKARTTGRAKRKIKSALIPGYGKRGMGWIRNPRRAMYNKVYRKTTFSLGDVLGKLFK